MLVLTFGSVATFLAIYFTAAWQFVQIVSDHQREPKKKALVKPVVVLFFITGLILVGFVNP